jgi:glycosyltransferase involved in cell wall biosynthesis
MTAPPRALGEPLVSVIIPCYNQGRFLADAIDSALSQTWPHVEVVVVDDGSEDNTPEIAARYPDVQYFRLSRGGVSAARNHGLGASRGSHVIFLDADDCLKPEAAAVGLHELAADPTLAFVSGRCTLIGFDGTPVASATDPVIERDHYDELLRNCYIWTNAAVMYRRIALTTIGGFDPSLSASADHDLYLRLARRFLVGSHGHVVAEYRRHGSNMTRDAGRSLRDRMKVLRRQRHVLGAGFTRYREAYRAGVAFARSYFGEPLLAAVVSDVATKHWRRAFGGYRTLVACYPRGAVMGLVWLSRMIASMRSFQK